jgi:hypothetical protein
LIFPRSQTPWSFLAKLRKRKRNRMETKKREQAPNKNRLLSKYESAQ